MKKGLDGEPTFDELNQVRQKKTWVHTVLKGLIYGSFESVIRTASYGTRQTWYTDISQVKDNSVRELWTLKDSILQAVADSEGRLVSELRQSRSIYLGEQAFYMLVTIVDWDGSWKRRLQIALNQVKKFK